MRPAALVLVTIFGLGQTALAQVFTGLGRISGDTLSRATAISADGTTVVGDGYMGQGIDAWRWRAGSPLQLIGTQFAATSVSADGAAVAGVQVPSPFSRPAFRWTSQAGIQLIPNMQGSIPSP